MFQWHACKLAKLSASIAKYMTTINKIYIFLHLHSFVTLYSNQNFHGQKTMVSNCPSPGSIIGLHPLSTIL